MTSAVAAAYASRNRAHDQWAAAYLVAVLRSDVDALVILLDGIEQRDVWDVLDAVSITTRDLLDGFGVDPELAADALSGKLITDAFRESTASPEDTAGG
jgi:hypothetical protein